MIEKPNMADINRAEAMADFDQNWWKQQAPKSALRAKSADNG